MALSTKPAAFYADFGGLASLKGAARNQDPKALREAARQFESLFTQTMLKTMRQASDALPTGESLMDNDQSKMYLEMFDNQLALQLSKGRGLGLADMLVRQLGPQLGQSDLVEPKTAGKANTFAIPTGKKTIASPVDLAPVKNTSQATQDQHFVPLSLPYLQETLSEPRTTPVPTAPVEAPVTDTKGASLSTVIPVSLAPSVKESTKDPVRPQPLAKDAADFVKQLWPHAQKAARELGVDAKTLIAHAALETGWGKFVPCNPDGTCSFNLFGIKATSRWAGPSTAVNSLEYEDGVAVKRRSSFRVYESPADSFRDYASLIRNSSRYAAAVGAGDDVAAFASALQQGGYATDPNYATKLAATAARLGSMAPVNSEKLDALKLANNRPLTTGSSVSAGDTT